MLGNFGCVKLLTGGDNIQAKGVAWLRQPGQPGQLGLLANKDIEEQKKVLNQTSKALNDDHQKNDEKGKDIEEQKKVFNQTSKTLNDDHQKKNDEKDKDIETLTDDPHKIDNNEKARRAVYIHTSQSKREISEEENTSDIKEKGSHDLKTFLVSPQIPSSHFCKVLVPCSSNQEQAGKVLMTPQKIKRFLGRKTEIDRRNVKVSQYPADDETLVTLLENTFVQCRIYAAIDYEGHKDLSENPVPPAVLENSVWQAVLQNTVLQDDAQNTMPQYALPSTMPQYALQNTMPQYALWIMASYKKLPFCTRQKAT